ncbi:MAG: PilZ domain-containing protein [Desulfovibrionaceae bacterium]
MKEERRSRRASARKSGFLTILEHIFPFVTLDISKSGVSISVRASIPVDTRCVLTFEDNQSLLFSSFVVRTKNNICALVFSDLTSEHIEYLESLSL